MRLASGSGISENKTERRAISYLPLLLCESAASAFDDLEAGRLEWRSDTTLEQFRASGQITTIIAPSLGVTGSTLSRLDTARRISHIASKQSKANLSIHTPNARFGQDTTFVSTF